MDQFSPKSLEQRQHISLSNYAYKVISNDSLTFFGKMNLSGFINRVVINMSPEFFEEYEYQYKNHLIELHTNYRPGSESMIPDDARKAIETMSKNSRKHLSSQLESYNKDVSLKIRLQNDLYSIMYPDSGTWADLHHGVSQGKYIKMMIEYYSRKTFYEREQIIFKEIYDSLLPYADNPENNRMLCVVLSDGSKYKVKPYRLSSSHESRYNYLIGLSSLTDESDFKPASFRLSRIKEASFRKSYGSGRITSWEKESIEDSIQSKGVEHLVGEIKEFNIRLTPIGVNWYNSIYHLRPIYTTRTEDDIYTFICTEQQIKNYFILFGSNAEILSPEDTREYFSSFYANATKSYNRQ